MNVTQIGQLVADLATQSDRLCLNDFPRVWQLSKLHRVGHLNLRAWQRSFGEIEGLLSRPLALFHCCGKVACGVRVKRSGLHARVWHRSDFVLIKVLRVFVVLIGLERHKLEAIFVELKCWGL